VLRPHQDFSLSPFAEEREDPILANGSRDEERTGTIEAEGEPTCDRLVKGPAEPGDVLFLAPSIDLHAFREAREGLPVLLPHHEPPMVAVLIRPPVEKETNDTLVLTEILHVHKHVPEADPKLPGAHR
jgi:hypothetical protein